MWESANIHKPKDGFPYGPTFAAGLKIVHPDVLA